jgi:hypothetical protein
MLRLFVMSCVSLTDRGPPTGLCVHSAVADVGDHSHCEVAVPWGHPSLSQRGLSRGGGCGELQPHSTHWLAW